MIELTSTTMRRRRRGASLKAQILAKCARPGTSISASIAGVVVAHGINANLVHKWRAQATRETCGPERLRKELAGSGVQVGVHRIRRLRKKLGLRRKQKRKFKATTDSRHILPLGRGTGPGMNW